MTSQEFKKIELLFRRLEKEMEDKAIEYGWNVFSPKYDQVVENEKQKVLATFGFTLDDYEKHRQEVLQRINFVKGENGVTPEKGKDYFTPDEIEKLKEEIIKEVTPVKGVDYFDGKDGKDGADGKSPELPTGFIENTDRSVDFLKSDLEKFKGETGTAIQALKEQQTSELKIINSNVLNMPDFRKLAMGLQAQIDSIRSGGTLGKPAGSNTQVQYNDGGVFGADKYFTWDKVNKILYLGNPSGANNAPPHTDAQVSPPSLDSLSVLNNYSTNAIFIGQSSLTFTDTSAVNGGTVSVYGATYNSPGYSGLFGGDVWIQGGNAFDNLGNPAGTGGDTVLVPGQGTTNGRVLLKDPTSGRKATLNTSSLSSSDQIYTFPDASGTFAISASGNIALSALGNITFTGTLPVGNGGTGITSYAVGDIIYASGATTLSKLADVATGNALISGGVGVAPSWGKIGLTTHVSGVLPIANGGTNNSSTYNSGSIIFSDGTKLTSDTSNFNWDATNHYIGIGKVAADVIDARKDTNAEVNIHLKNGTAGTAANTQFKLENDLGNLVTFAIYSSATSTYGALVAKTGYWYSNTSVGMAIMADNPAGIIKFATGGNSEKMRLDASGNLGIGTTSPNSTLDVEGSIFPHTNNAYYLGKNSSTNPFAWKGVILKDTTNGTYYRIEVINGVITATAL